jgi:crotonobetainyl-CoA:carnitine CoA-transferase CaiB-like acyl-CoA transferase
VAREANAAELSSALEAVFAEKTADAWEQELGSRGVACVRADRGPVGHFVMHEPFAREAGFVADVEDAEFGPYSRYGATIHLSRDSGEVNASNPAGAQNHAILTDLGYTPEQIEELERSGAVGTHS